MVNPRSTWGQLGINLRLTWGQPGVNLGSTWGQAAPPYWVFRQVDPEAERVGSGGDVVFEHVADVDDPERGWRLIRLQERRGAHGQHPEV